MRQDAREKRARLIDSHVKIRETFSFAHPEEQLKDAEKYCMSLYGSNLYDFNDKEFEMICSAWRTGVKPTCLFTRLEQSSLVPAGFLTPQFLQKK